MTNPFVPRESCTDSQLEAQRSIATNTTTDSEVDISAAARFFTQPAVHDRLASFQSSFHTQGAENAPDDGIRQIFLGLSAFFHAMASSSDAADTDNSLTRTVSPSVIPVAGHHLSSDDIQRQRFGAGENHWEPDWCPPSVPSKPSTSRNPSTTEKAKNNEGLVTEIPGADDGGADILRQDKIAIAIEKFRLQSLEEWPLLEELGLTKSSAAEADGASQIERICHGIPSQADMVWAQGLHSNEGWVLNHRLRTALYAGLFDAMAPAQGAGGRHWHIQVLKSNIDVVRKLQGFMLAVSMCWSTQQLPAPSQLPNLEILVVDVLEMVEILKTPADSLSLSYSDTHPHYQFNRTRYASWLSRWGNCCYELKTAWEPYICDLCDAIFGMHPKQPGLYCVNRAKESSWIRSILSLDMASKPSTAVGIDYRIFDAASIERHGPFRFVPTDRIDVHMTTDGYDILYYSDWKKWAYLSWHSVLRKAQNINMRGQNASFDTLVNKGRVRAGEVHYSAAMVRLSKDILMTNILCFHQASLYGRKKRRRVLSFFSKLRNRGLGSSEAIGSRLGGTLSNKAVVALAESFVAAYAEDWESLFEISMPFRERQIKLYNQLKSWKPKTIWEMRYPGYGGVDPVGLYAFYFAAVLGTLSILGLGMAAAQTYAAFQQLKITPVL